jgi:hypothetical protein
VCNFSQKNHNSSHINSTGSNPLKKEKESSNINGATLKLLEALKSVSVKLDKIEELNNEIIRNNFTQIGNGNQQIGNQNNFYNSTMFRPIQMNNKTKIFCYTDGLFRLNNIFYFLIFVSVAILTIIGFFLMANSNMEPQGYILMLTLVLFLFITGYLIYVYFKRKKVELIINQTNISLGNKKIEYNKIRSILKRKTLIHYSIDIYKIDSILPVAEIDFITIHEANSVNELIISKIKNLQSVI